MPFWSPYLPILVFVPFAIFVLTILAAIAISLWHRVATGPLTASLLTTRPSTLGRTIDHAAETPFRPVLVHDRLQQPAFPRTALRARHRPAIRMIYNGG